jgi:hypothetical protein
MPGELFGEDLEVPRLSGYEIFSETLILYPWM